MEVIIIGKIIPMAELSNHIRSGMRIMIGGFLGLGQPLAIVDFMLENGIGDITLISNDSSFVDRGLGKLIAQGRVKKLITSHIGTNIGARKLVMSGALETEIMPLGTLVERIHAGGAGLGGVLLPTGVGTLVEEGKRKLTVDGRDYLLETPIRAELALIKASVCDRSGNIQYTGTSRNINPVMSMAADTVIVETDALVETGNMDPSFVHTSGVLVDYIVVNDSGIPGKDKSENRGERNG